MKWIPRGITQEFQEQAVRLHEVDGMTIPEVAKRLSLPGGTLKNWVYAVYRGKLGEGTPATLRLQEIAGKPAQVKRELAKITMEHDLLKKVATYFARGSR